MTNPVQEDGYVECTECGHSINDHDTRECLGCSCPVRWTKQEIIKVRRANGLPAQRRPY